MNHNPYNPDRMQNLSELAEYYVEKYCGVGVMVKPQQIARVLGLPVCINDYGNAFDGLMNFRKGNFYIHLNLKKSGGLHQPRVRFTLAHELAHYIIDEHREALMLPGASPHGSFPLIVQDNLVEREADHFAASLLMPEARLFNLLPRKWFNPMCIPKISETFQVSLVAAMLRYIAVGKHPVMMICCREGRIIWYRQSKHFPYRWLKAAINDPVPENTAAGDYYYKNLKHDAITTLVKASRWFKNPDDPLWCDEVNERCFYTDSVKQVISVVWEG